jgi:hypothetical protein
MTSNGRNESTRDHKERQEVREMCRPDLLFFYNLLSWDLTGIMQELQ